MAQLREVLEALQDGEAATRRSHKGDYTMYVHLDATAQEWVVKRSTHGMPPHMVLTFGDVVDVAAYFQAIEMLDEWKVTQTNE